MKSLFLSILVLASILFSLTSCGVDPYPKVTYSLSGMGQTETIKGNPETAPDEQVFVTSFPKGQGLGWEGIEWETTNVRPAGLDTTDIAMEVVDDYLFVHVIGKKRR